MYVCGSFPESNQVLITYNIWDCDYNLLLGHGSEVRVVELKISIRNLQLIGQTIMTYFPYI